MLLNNYRRILVNSLATRFSSDQVSGMTGEIKTTVGTLINPTKKSYQKYPVLSDLGIQSDIAVEATYYNGTVAPDTAWSFSGSKIYLGTGNVTPTIGDYKLSGELITGLTSQAQDIIATNNSITFSAIATNNTESPVTIKEIGLGGHYGDSTSSLVVLLTRDVLATPVTLNVGDSKTFSITIDFRSLTDTTVNE